MSSTDSETIKLQENLKKQLNRLLSQLDDIESNKDDLEEDEYKQMKEDTLEQLSELQRSHSKFLSGDISLLDSLGLQLKTTKEQIAQAFNAPEITKFFGKDVKYLRECIGKLESSSSESSDKKKAELLLAIRQAGEKLTQDELRLIEKYNRDALSLRGFEFQEVDDDNAK